MRTVDKAPPGWVRQSETDVDYNHLSFLRRSGRLAEGCDFVRVKDSTNNRWDAAYFYNPESLGRAEHQLADETEMRTCNTVATGWLSNHRLTASR